MRNVCGVFALLIFKKCLYSLVTKGCGYFFFPSLFFPVFRTLPEFYVPSVDVLEESHEVFPALSPSCTSLRMALLGFYRAR